MAHRPRRYVGVILGVTLVGMGMLLLLLVRRGVSALPAATAAAVPSAVAPDRGVAALRMPALPPRAAGSGAPAIMAPAAFIDAGYATADAAVVTFIWALAHGNVDVAGQGIALDAHGRATIEAFLARLPPDVAAQYRPPERFIALLWAGEWADAGELAGVKVLDTRRTAGAASVRLECRFAGGRKYRFRLNLAPSAAGWQTQVEASLVDGFISNHFFEPETVSLR